MRTWLIIVVAIFNLTGLVYVLWSPTAHASSSTQLTLSIKPLQCSVDTVHDGITAATYVKSASCQKALNATYLVQRSSSY